MTVPKLFDVQTRAIKRQRLKQPQAGFIATILGDDLLERLDDLNVKPASVMVIGTQPMLEAGLKSRGYHTTIVTDADRHDNFALEPHSYDLILSSGLLDTLNDLPGALIQMRRALKPGGQLLANLIAAPSLPTLRSCVATTDAAFGIAAARFHPLIDVRGGGDLLVRAGFANPVATIDSLTIAYPSVQMLRHDLREAALSNILVDRHPVTRGWYNTLASAFQDQATADGRISEVLSWVTFSGQNES